MMSEMVNDLKMSHGEHDGVKSSIENEKMREKRKAAKLLKDTVKGKLKLIISCEKTPNFLRYSLNRNYEMDPKHFVK